MTLVTTTFRGVALAISTALLVALSPFAQAQSQKLDVLSAGAVKSALEDMIAGHGKANGGLTISQVYIPVGPIMKQLADGAKPDVIVLSEEAMADAVAKGFIKAGSVRTIGRVGIGVAIKTGAPRPDISTPEAFKATMLAAQSIVYVDPTRGTSGRHFASVLEKLGIAEAMKPKTTLLPGGYVVEPVGKGEIEIGVHQITEILPVPGVTMIGPLPPALQKITVYVIGVGANAANPQGAEALIAAVTGDAAKPVLNAKGFMAAP